MTRGLSGAVNAAVRRGVASDVDALDPVSRRVYLAARDAAMARAREGARSELSRDVLLLGLGLGVGSGAMGVALFGAPALAAAGLAAAGVAIVLALLGPGSPVATAAGLHAFALDVAARSALDRMRNRSEQGRRPNVAATSAFSDDRRS